MKLKYIFINLNQRADSIDGYMAKGDEIRTVGMKDLQLINGDYRIKAS